MYLGSATVKQALALWIAAAAFVVVSSPALAHTTHHHKSGHAKKQHAAKVRYGGKPGRGYWRPGPEKGYGFRFATYKGDPFGSDDYFDGDRCHYDHHQNFCIPNKIFNGFWDRPTAR